MVDKFEENMLLRIKNANHELKTDFDKYKAGKGAAYERALEAYRYYKDMGWI